MISNVSWSLPNAHVYHQKPLFVPSRRKHVISLQLIPRVSDACFAATMDWSISHSWQVWWFCPKIFLARCFCAQFELSIINYVCMVVLLYPDISNFKILKCKIFLINFLDESGNFKQKNFYTSKCNFFTFYNNRPYLMQWISLFFGNARNYAPAFLKNAGNSLHQKC